MADPRLLGARNLLDLDDGAWLPDRRLLARGDRVRPDEMLCFATVVSVRDAVSAAVAEATPAPAVVLLDLSFDAEGHPHRGGDRGPPRAPGRRRDRVVAEIPGIPASA